MIKAKKNYGTVIEGKLYWGNEILAKDEEELKQMGINAILNLIHYKNPEDEIHYKSKDITLVHLSIKDLPTNTIHWCEEGSKFIEEQLKLGKIVYVHCIYGISRSSTQIMHYLITRQHYTLKKAFFYLRKTRHIVCPTYGFMKGLSELDKQLNGEESFPPLEYSYLAIEEVLPHIPRDEIERVFEESRKEVEKNLDYWEKRKVKENIEPTGFVCYDKLFALHGEKKFIPRFGCSKHHAFD